METTLDTKSLGELAGKPEVLDTMQDRRALALPPGWTSKDFEEDERKLDAPKRIRRVVTAHEVSGFTSYVNRFKGETTALYCRPQKETGLLARLDDHQPDKPSHVEHTVSFACPVSEEWTRWMKANRTEGNQRAFAEFIEENIRDVVEPTGADFLSAITNFSDTRTVEFRSAQRLADGRTQFTYMEREQANQVALPSVIKIALPIFMGMPDRYAIEARIKYRLKDADLTMWFELDRPDLAHRQAYADLIAAIEQATELQVHRAI